MELAKLVISLKLDNGDVAILRAGPALEAWEMCTEVMSPSDGQVATLMMYLGRRVVAYRVGEQCWRALSAFERAGLEPTEPSPTMF